MWAFLTLALAAAPKPSPAVTDLFAFELDGTPVGTVQLSLGGARFGYRSRQLFTRGQRSQQVTRSIELAVDGRARLAGTALVPESLWLWLRPAEGCVQGRDELTGKEGELCAFAAKEKVQGSVFGEGFEASYGADGRLSELRLGHGRFVRVSPKAAVRAPPELFADGFEIEGKSGELALSPPPAAAPHLEPALRAKHAAWNAAEARALAREVHDSPEADGPAQGPCLSLAKRFVAKARERGEEATVVIGLIEDGGRAYPHAWVRVGLSHGEELELDPTWLEPVSPRTHLALAGGGAELLELLAGRVKVVRRLGSPWGGGAGAR